MKIGIIGYHGFLGKSLTSGFHKRYPHIQLFLFGKRNYPLFSGFPSVATEAVFEECLQKNPGIFNQLDYIFYLKSATIPASSWNNPEMEWEYNAAPFLRLLNVLHPRSLKKIIFISSAGTVYGNSPKPHTENDPCRPFSPYGIMKLCMENFLNYYRVRKNIEFDIFRITNVYGPGQDVSRGLGVINTIIDKILKNEKIIIYGDGNQVRNFIFIDDVTEYLMAAVQQNPINAPVNMGHDRAYSINEILDIIRSIHPEFSVEYLPARPSDNPYAHADIRLLKHFYPDIKQTDIRTGIQKTYQAIKEQSDTDHSDK